MAVRGWRRGGVDLKGIRGNRIEKAVALENKHIWKSKKGMSTFRIVLLYYVIEPVPRWLILPILDIGVGHKT